MKLTGSQTLVECLLEQGVDTVFGYPGGTILNVYNALYDSSIKHVLTVHEQGAIHAADGYARASGRPGVCVVTSGPGACNIVTGLATAYMDSVPVVAITGQVCMGQIGSDAFQEIDICSISLPITKHNFMVTDPEELPHIVRQAFEIAQSGRPGPVLIDIPVNVQVSTIEFERLAEKPSIPALPVEENLKEKTAAAWEMLEQAQKPMILFGGGVIKGNASEEVLALAEKLGAPIASTLMGLGGFPMSHDQFLGMTGLHGHKLANLAIFKSDVLVVIGCRFSDRVTSNREKYAPEKKVIYIDLDPAEVNKNVPVDLSLIGDIRISLQKLAEVAQKLDRPKWWSKIKEWQAEFEEEPITEVTAPWAMQKMNELGQGQDIIYVTDVGQHQMWAAQNLKIEQPRHWVTSGGCGTMGFGLPAAMGAQFAEKDRRVVVIAGDAGFKMTGNELYTVAQHQVPVISIIIDNHSLGMVRQLQQLFYNERYIATKIPVFNFEQYVESFGIPATTVTEQSQFIEAYEKALANKRPCAIIVKIKQSDLVTPMLRPGASLKEYVQIETDD